MEVIQVEFIEDIYIYMSIFSIYIKTSLNRSTMGRTLNGLFKEVIGLGSWNIVTIELIVNHLGPK